MKDGVWSSRRISTPTTPCGSPRCRRWNRSSCVPSGGLLGRRRRADHLRCGAGGAQRLLQGDGQTHPLGPAEGPEHHVRPDANRAAAALEAAAPFREICSMEALCAAVAIARSWRRQSAGASRPPSRRRARRPAPAAMPPGPTAQTPVPRLYGRNADEIVTQMTGVPRRQARGNDHEPHRQGILPTTEIAGDRGLVRRRRSEGRRHEPIVISASRRVSAVAGAGHRGGTDFRGRRWRRPRRASS